MANNNTGRVFGHIPRTTVGQKFADRAELAKELRESGHPLIILTEQEWMKFI